MKAHTINETTEDKSKATLIAQDLCEYFHYCDGDTIQMLLYLSEYEKNDNSVLVYFNEAGAICTYASAKYEAILTFDKDSSYQMLMLDIHRVNGTDSLYNSYIKKYVPSVL